MTRPCTGLTTRVFVKTNHSPNASQFLERYRSIAKTFIDMLIHSDDTGKRNPPISSWFTSEAISAKQEVILFLDHPCIESILIGDFEAS